MEKREKLKEVKQTLQKDVSQICEIWCSKWNMKISAKTFLVHLPQMQNETITSLNPVTGYICSIYISILICTFIGILVPYSRL